MYYPLVLGSNGEKLAPFRMQKQFPEGDPRRYPLGRFPFRCDIAFGSVTMTRDGAMRINTPRAVETSANKVRCKKIWKDNNVPQVDNFAPLTNFVRNNEFLIENFEAKFNYPCVVKLNSGSKGEGMRYIKSYEDLNDFLTNTTKLRRFHFEDFTEFDQEFRIHVSPWLVNKTITYRFTRPGIGKNKVEQVNITRNNGVIYFLQKKIKQDAFDNGVRHTNRAGKYDSIIFTSRFEHQPWMDTAITEAVRAIKLLGLDFGFVDVGYSRSTGKFVFFESGCNPELKPEGPESQCYIQALPHIILYKGASCGRSIQTSANMINQQVNPTVQPKARLVSLGLRF